jgi:hypothetical protein
VMRCSLSPALPLWTGDWGRSARPPFRPSRAPRSMPRPNEGGLACLLSRGHIATGVGLLRFCFTAGECEGQVARSKAKEKRGQKPRHRQRPSRKADRQSEDLGVHRRRSDPEAHLSTQKAGVPYQDPGPVAVYGGDA